MLKVKLGRPVVSHFVRIVALLGRRVNLSVVRVIITTAAHFSTLYKKGGIRFLVIYLKAAHTLVQQSIGGQRLRNMTALGCRIARTGGGLPRCIPAIHRARIRQGDVWVIRFWLTLFGLYRVLSFLGRAKLTTITAPTTMDATSLLPEFSQFVVDHFWPVVKKTFPVEGSVFDALWPEEGEGPLEYVKRLRAKPFVISKSGPQAWVDGSRVGILSTSPAAVLIAARLWTRSSLFPFLKDWIQMTGNTGLLNRIVDWASGPWTTDTDSATEVRASEAKFDVRPTGFLGKLGFKEEPAGKVRVFAMVDPITQWLLKPLHDGIFNLLRAIPQDGTFDQMAPLHRLLERQEQTFQLSGRRPALFSFDLSAATDRIPILLQMALLSPVLTSWGAELWRILLVGRGYTYSSKLASPMRGTLMYACGQPMGALSSWAMLALVHHCIVQWAALRAGVITIGGTWFGDYAVLGDDIVIMHGAVARHYRKIMAAIGVDIGDHKSLVSRNGLALEFAKRTLYNGVDVSGVPFREFVIGLQSAAGLMELIRKYSLSVGTMLSALGYGYRAKAKASSRIVMLPQRLRHYLIMYYGPGSPNYTGLVRWFTLKTVSQRYKATMERVSSLCASFLETERDLILKRLDGLLPLIEEAKRLGTVYRDREHYGTVPEGAGRVTRPFAHVYDVPQRTLDSVNETVFREAFLDTAIAFRDLRTQLEELSCTTLDWAGLENLWSQVREIESMIGALPLPRDLVYRTSGRAGSRFSEVLKRWYRYSRVFRATDT